MNPSLTSLRHRLFAFTLTLACFLASLAALHAQEPATKMRVLIIGSTRDTPDNSFINGTPAPFLAANIRDHLQTILTDKEAYTDLQVSLLNRSAEGYSTSVFSLAQWFYYPYPANIETTTRWPFLRGEPYQNVSGTTFYQSGATGTDWDHVILIGDPYTMENMPGLYAHGVGLIAEEVAKGGGQTTLLMPWPSASSTSSVAHYNEVVSRAGQTGGCKVAPAALAWDADGASPKPTPDSDRGAFICAASIYSTIWEKSASSSTPPGSYDNTLADAVHATVTSYQSSEPYTGRTSFQNPFLTLGDTRRDVHYSDKGSSTEAGMRGNVGKAMDRCRVGYVGPEHWRYSVYNRYDSNTPEDDGLGWPTDAAMPIAFNHGRSSGYKSYVVNPDYWQLGMGYTYQSNTWGYTPEAASDFFINRMFTSDLGLAARMITEDDTARCMPMRLIWADYSREYPTHNPLADGTGPHLNGNLLSAIGTYMYTLYSGRCPVDPKPSNPNSGWYAQKAGYETAWRLGTGSARAPGFKVLPSSRSALSVTPTTTETMSVQFIFAPRSEVTVTVSSSDPTAAIVGAQTLVFTPDNYDTPQTVTVAGVPGSTASAPFTVDFTTSSDDGAYDGLTDSWSYTCERAVTATTPTDRGTIHYSTPKNSPLTINLGASGANSGNTTLLGANHGTLEWSGSDLIYTPDTDYAGPDGFAYACSHVGVLTMGYIEIDVIDGYLDGSVRAEATDSSAAEQGQATGTFTITREGDTASALVVNFSISGSATSGSDYHLSSGSPVTIPAGQASVDITLTPVDDSLFGERDEYATLTIAAGSGYTEITNPATVTIADNDNTAPVVDAGSDQSATLQASHTQAGLWYGTVPGNINTTDPNPKTLLIADVAAYTEDDIASDTTEIYTGQIFDADGSISFTAQIDNKARIWIDGVLVVTNDSIEVRKSTGNLNLTPGWHDIEIRISNGTGSSGPPSSPGIGYDPNGGIAWQTLSDPGDQSLLRAEIPDRVTVTLDGEVTDADAQTPATTWTVASGPTGVSFGDLTAIDTTASFTAPGTYVLRLTADDGYGPVYDEVSITVSPVVTSVLTVTGGSGDGSYRTDTGVEITADAPASGYRFLNWTTSDGGSFADANSATTIYTMPANAAEVTANYELNTQPVVDAGADQNVPFIGSVGPTQMILAPTDAIQGFQSTLVGGDSTDGGNWPSNQNPQDAIDGDINSKYLNFGKVGSGFYITPGVGARTLTGVRIITAEDSSGRDPLTISIEGANGGDLSQGSSWTLIQDDINLGIDFDPGRLTAGPLVAIRTFASYTSYRIIVKSLRNPADNSAQYSGIELYGFAGSFTTVDLSGSASDADGDALTTTWSIVSKDPAGAADPIFADASQPSTGVAFSEEGTYLLRLTADDGNGSPVSDEATITVIPLLSYALTVTGGSGDGIHDHGAEVEIAADAPASGYRFVNWTTTDGGSFADANAANTTYTMPGNAAEITANYELNSQPLVDAGNNQTISINPSPPWTPAETTTAAWYDASDAATIIATNGAVSQWNDKSGNDKHAVAGAGQPTYNSASSSVSGTAATPMTLPNDLYASASSGCLVWVGTQDTENGGWGNYGRSNNIHSPLSNGIMYDAFLSNSRASASTNVSGMLGKQTIQSRVQTGTNLEMWSDGTQIYSGAQSFNSNPNETKFFDIDSYTLNEVVFLPDADISTRLKVEGYLAHKWGLVSELPLDHPYKASSPKGSGLVAANLDGSATDADGDSLTTTWSIVSKDPNTAADPTFGNASQPITTASFSEEGTYVLRLTADDGYGSAVSDEVTITVVLAAARKSGPC